MPIYRGMTDEDIAIGFWLSAALEDENVCEEMKHDIDQWFKTFMPQETCPDH